MSVYADSSFLVSHYLQDAHSSEVDRRMGGRPSIWMTPFHKTEMAHVIFLHIFCKKLSIADANLSWSVFEKDCSLGLWAEIKLPEKAWEAAIDLARRYGPTLGVRTLDSLHVACALELKSKQFWTFDDRQARLAEAVGLDTSS